MALDQEVDDRGPDLTARVRAAIARRRKGRAVLLGEKEEGQRTPAVEVGGAQHHLAESRLAQVLGREGHVALAELRFGGRTRGEGRSARDLPQPAPQALLAGAHVEERFEE